MLRYQGYSLRPRNLDGAQTRVLTEMDVQARWLWNLYLRADLNRRERGQAPASYGIRAAVLTRSRSRADLAWLAEGSAPAQQTGLRRLGEVWERFFKGLSRPPVFKRKTAYNRFCWSGRQEAELDQTHGRIKLLNHGWVRYRNSRRVEGEASNVAIRPVGDKRQMSAGTEREVGEPTRRGLERRVGLDPGIACHPVTSDGWMNAGPNALGEEGAKLRRAQHKQARRKQGRTSADNAQGRIGQKPPVELRTLPKTKKISVL